MKPTAEPTPRTDALWDQAASNLTGYDITEKARRYEIALWEHARQLERELSLAQSRLAEVEKDAARFKWWAKWWTDERDELETINSVGGADTPDEFRAAIDEAIKRSSESSPS